MRRYTNPLTARSPGIPSDLTAETYSGEYRPSLGDNLVCGRWFTGPGEAVPTEGFMRQATVGRGEAAEGHGPAPVMCGTGTGTGITSLGDEVMSIYQPGLST
ncbi:hypothetical protein GCM10023196_107650 [Actinoallomurus vinaceus]|uniref:Uncharacterized protein n=1 Tax=Actinoallomurus vinaceus TaxID=1080074 RepID=A0ABP8UUZ3_9ACTN